MELKVLIVSIACLSCFMPPVFCTGVLEAKAAIGAAKGAALLGAKALVAKEAALLAKGAGVLVAKGAVAIAAKGAAALAAKGPLLKGLLAAKGTALLAAKGAALKGALAAKGALLGGAVALGAKAVKAGAGIIAGKLPQPTVILQESVEIPPAPVLTDFVIDYKPEFTFPLPRPPPPISTVTVEVQEPKVPDAAVELIRGKLPLVWGKLRAAAGLKAQFLAGLGFKETPLVYDIIQSPKVYSTPYLEVTEEINQPINKQLKLYSVANNK